MQRTLPSRRVVGLAIAVTAAAGIGFGAYTIGSAAGANSSHLPRIASATTTPVDPAGPEVPAEPGASTPAEAPASPLTLEEAQAVALEVAPGRVVEWDEDNEPTGLRYDVTVLHDDGTTTDVEVDTVTGQVTSIDHDDDRY
jgi:Peptidase propeptide and YPEB domain